MSLPSYLSQNRMYALRDVGRARCVQELAHEAIGPGGPFGIVLVVVGEVLVALGERHELVEDAVLGPARHRNHLADGDATRQLVHARQTQLRIPREDLVIVGRARTEAAELYAWRKRCVLL